ncbi:MAG: T9SS type A sorting domain-containing protein, partial [Bacteriovoracaceae bacterium]|nr:T9SS type A sorting domain-containing protein [Bacteriovoracaceae bacterium]
IMKCLIKGNTADGDGGGIFIGYAEQMSLTNSIITNNLSISASGGGLHYNQSSLHIINSIIHNNSPLNISVWGDVLYNYPINFYNSIIEGGVESIVTTFPNGWVTIGSYSNCFDADPLFLNAEAGDYSVSDSSPAIDAGTALVTWGDTIYYTPQSNYEGFAPDIGLSETSQSLLHEPSNLEVIDVPGDQGGYIYLNWNRSFDDSEWLGNISVYSIWQRVPQTNLGRKVNSNTADLVTDSYKVLRDELWFNVATIPALQHETYSALLETFADSSESGINMTYLLITAHTTDPLIYYESQIDSGYSVNNEAVSISENYDVIPKQFYLNQNYPNPFNPTTTIQYGLPEDASVSLTIYDIQGNEIITIDSGLQSAGWYHHTWNGLDDYGQPVSTGLYLARLHAESYSKTIKMVYLK